MEDERDVRWVSWGSRFDHEISFWAKKPGYLVATASFSRQDAATMMWIIEGPRLGDLTIKGFVTDFEKSRIWRARITGLQILEDLPKVAEELSFDVQLEWVSILGEDPRTLPRRFVAQRARFIPTPQRGPNGIDPDGVLLRLTSESGEKLDVSIANYREGCWLLLVGVGVVLALACSGCSNPDRAPDDVMDKKSGGFKIRSGLIEAQVDWEHEEKWHNPPGPVSVRSGIAPQTSYS